MEEKWYQKGEICHLWAIPQSGTGTKTGWYRYPNWQNQIGTGTKTSGTGTHLQNKFGTGTKYSGIDTTASSSLDFCNFASLSPNSYTDSMGTLIND